MGNPKTELSKEIPFPSFLSVPYLAFCQKTVTVLISTTMPPDCVFTVNVLLPDN